MGLHNKRNAFTCHLSLLARINNFFRKNCLFILMSIFGVRAVWGGVWCVLRLFANHAKSTSIMIVDVVAIILLLFSRAQLRLIVCVIRLFWSAIGDRQRSRTILKCWMFDKFNSANRTYSHYQQLLHGFCYFHSFHSL